MCNKILGEMSESHYWTEVLYWDCVAGHLALLPLALLVVVLCQNALAIIATMYVTYVICMTKGRMLT